MPDIVALIKTVTHASEGSFRRRMAVADLARSKEPQAIETLIALLDDDDAYLRREVVAGLAKTEDAVVIEPLIRALDDDDDYLQRDAAEALGRFGDRRAIGALRKLLDDNSYSVRYAAERSLEQIAQRVPPPEVTEDEPPATTPTPATATAPPPSPATPPPKTDSVEADALEDIVQATRVDVPQAPVNASVVAAAKSPVSAPLQSAPTVPSSTPLVAITAISTLQPPESIVTAELSTSAASGWQATSERETQVTPARVPSERNWGAAKRFQTMFGTAASELPDMYDGLSKAETDLVESERDYHLVLKRLGDEESANRGGLARLEHELDEAAKQLAELQREQNRSRRKQHTLAREASTVSFQIASFMASQKCRQNREATRTLESDIKRLGAVAAETRTRQETLQRKYETLAAPLKQLQQQAEELADSRASGRRAIGDASRKIDTWMSEHLLRLPTEDLRQRIAKLAESSPNATVLATCADELVRAVAEVEDRSAELLDVEVAAQQAVAAAEASTDALGAAIAAGFRLTSAERRTNVRLSGSLRFTEQRGTFSGFDGADGTANGSGSGQAAYTIDDVQWAATCEFGKRVTAFTAAWTECGDAAARSELLHVLIAAGRRRAGDLARLIRTELEQDFAGGHQG